MNHDDNWLYAEQAVLGSVLIDDRCAGKMIFGLGPDDFQLSAYRSIYEAIKELYTTGRPVDPVTVLDQIGGGPEMKNLVLDLMEITPTAANIDRYIEICRKRSQLHKYHLMGERLSSAETSEEAVEPPGLPPTARQPITRPGPGRSPNLPKS